MSNPEDYEVGYMKTPKATQFQKGQSGNPSGRPKGRKSMNAMFLEQMHQEQEFTEQGVRKSAVRPELIFHVIYQGAMKGDPKMIELYLKLAREAEREYSGSFDDPFALFMNPFVSAFDNEPDIAQTPPKPVSEYKFDIRSEIIKEAKRRGCSVEEVASKLKARLKVGSKKGKKQKPKKDKKGEPK